MKEFDFKTIRAGIESHIEGAPYLFVTLANDGHSYSIKVGETEKIAEAMFRAIIINSSKKDVGTEIYRAIKDVLLNLFEADDKFRVDFVNEMMNYSAAMSIQHKKDKK